MFFCPGLESPCAQLPNFQCAVSVSGIFCPACVWQSHAIKRNFTMKHVGANACPEGFEWLRDGYVRFSDPVRCACRAFSPACTNTKCSMFFLSGARIPPCGVAEFSMVFPACVRQSQAMKNFTMKHVGANSCPEGCGL